MPTKLVSSGLKVFIEFPDLPNGPRYELKESLTVGSEIGEVIIDHPEISPRHCTFYRNQDVISLLDHKSLTGTFIDDHAVKPGRMMILQDSDRIRLGPVNLRLIQELNPGTRAMQMEATALEMTISEAIEEESVAESTNTTSLLSNELAEGLKEELFDSYEPTSSIHVVGPETKTLNPSDTMKVRMEELGLREVDTKKPSARTKTLNVTQQLKKNKAKTPLKIELQGNTPREEIRREKRKPEPPSQEESKVEASNGFVRCIAVAIDALMAYGLLVILGDLEIVSNFLVMTENKIAELISPYFSTPLVSLVWEKGRSLVPLLLSFGIARVAMTGILGVSLGQGLVGIRSSSSPLWSRVGGVLRELIGLVTGPFLVFDFFTLGNTRSLKEVLTRTHLYTSSLLSVLLGLFLFLPLAGALALISPLWSGLESREAMLLSPDRLVPRPQGEGVDMIDSQFFRMRYSPDQEKRFEIYPYFQFIQKENKKIMTPWISVRSKEHKQSVEFTLVKTFEVQKIWRQFSQDLLLGEKYYPQFFRILGMENSGNLSAVDTKYFEDDAQKILAHAWQLSFSSLVQRLIGGAELNELGRDLIHLKALVKLRDQFLGVLGQTNPLTSGFIRLGDRIFINTLGPSVGGKITQSLIPLDASQGMVYQFEYAQSLQATKLEQEFLQFFFAQSFWDFSRRALDFEHDPNLPYHVFEVIDYFLKEDLPLDARMELNQYVFGYFFEFGKSSLQEGQEDKINLLKDIIRKNISAISGLEKKEASPEGGLGPGEKLVQNLSELISALETKDQAYFGISTELP